MDAIVESPWAVLRGEFVGQGVDAGGGDGTGWYLLAAAPVTPWLQPVAKYERFRRGGAGSVVLRAWTAGVNVRPWGRATRLTPRYVSRTAGDPGVRRRVGLAQVQIVF